MATYLLEDIAKKLNMTVSFLSEHLRKHGILESKADTKVSEKVYALLKKDFASITETTGESLVQEAIGYLESAIGIPKDCIYKEVPIADDTYRADLAVIIYTEIRIVVEVTTNLDNNINNIIFKASQKCGARYYLIFANNKPHWYKVETNGGVKLSANQIPTLKDIIDDISVIQNRVFNFLNQKRAENPSLTFRLRSQNRNSRLEKGYWFLGNEDYCVVSFWSGNDWRNKTPMIFLEINKYGWMTLTLIDNDNSSANTFYKNEIIPLLDNIYPDNKGEPTVRWGKMYYTSYQVDYITILNSFFNKEKRIIDNALKSKLLTAQISNSDAEIGSIGFIKEEVFLPLYERVLALQKDKDSVVVPKVSTSNIESNFFRVENVKFQNIGAFPSITLDLNARVCCILGLNGTGKTTLLRAMVLGLIGSELEGINRTKASLQNLMRIVGVNEYGIEKYSEQGSIEVTYTTQKDRHYKNTIDLYRTAQSKVAFNDRPESDFILADEDNFFKLPIIAFPQSHSFTQNVGQSIESESDLKAKLDDVSAFLYNEDDLRFSKLQEWIIRVYTDEFRKGKGMDAVHKILQIAREITGYEISPKLEIIRNTPDNKPRIWINLENEQSPITFELLSQGFKNVFAWIGHLVRRMSEIYEYDILFYEKQGLVIIDEIDTFLHPKWQSSILNILIKHFPKVQFIVTTHSPLLTSYLEEQDKAVYILRENQTPLRFTKTYGRSIEDIFYLLTNVPKRPSNLQKEIDNLFELLDDDKIDEAKALLDELKELLGSEDGAIIKAETMIDLITA